jgi:hypothetical protein
MFGTKFSGVGDMLGQAIKQRRQNMMPMQQTSADQKEFNSLNLGKGGALGSRVLPQFQGGYAQGQAVPTSIAIRRRRASMGPIMGMMGGGF